MNITRFVFAFAGSVILVSIVLTLYVSPWWLLLTAFVGANQLQTAFTGFCPLARILNWMGMKPGSAFTNL